MDYSALGEKMEPVVVHGCKFGDGIPKICVPIIGRSASEIIKEAEFIQNEAQKLERQYASSDICVSVIEVRADYFDGVANNSELIEMLRRLRKIFFNRLLLFTYRSEEEGGNLRHDRAENMVGDIYDWVISSGLVDMIDIELMSGNYYVVRMTTKAHEAGITCVLSNHDFEKTPRDDKTVEMLHNMEILGGDILKCVSTPKNEFDVRRVMELCKKVTEERLFNNNIRHPVVMISMGALGRITRISGRETGSAFTFASVRAGQESAPGQLALQEMFEIFSKPEKKK